MSSPMLGETDAGEENEQPYGWNRYTGHTVENNCWGKLLDFTLFLCQNLST